MPRVAALILGDEEICDLTAALPEQWQPIDPISFLKYGEDAFRRADEAVVEGVHRYPLSGLEILSPVPKPGQVVTVAGNYKPYDPSKDLAGEVDQEDQEAGQQKDGGETSSDEVSRIVSKIKGENGKEEDAGEDVYGEETDEYEKVSEKALSLPPESDDDEGRPDMDAEVKLHYELTLAGKERPGVLIWGWV